jgi:hypothetical protein
MSEAFAAPRRLVADRFDHDRMREAIIASGGSVQGASRLLGIPANYFYARAAAVGLDIPSARAAALERLAAPC